MATTALTACYAPNPHSVLSYYDEIIVTDTLPGRVTQAG